MSGRDLSVGYRAYLHARAPGDGAILLLRIVHADLGTLRFSPAGEDVVSGGQTYSGRAFRLPLPMDEDGVQETNLDLSIVGMDDGLVEDLLEASGDRPEVEADVVLLSDPDTVETTFFFQMRSSAAAGDVLGAPLIFEPVLVDPFCGEVYDASKAPDMFQ